MLVYCSDQWQCYDLGSLLKIATNSEHAERAINVVIIASTWICLVSYLIIIYDSLIPVISSMSQGNAPTFVGSRKFIITMASLIIYPLCFIPQQYLAGMSLISVLCNVYLFMVSLEQFSVNDREESCLLGYGLGAISMFCCTMQTTLIQMCVFPMYEEMDKRTPRRFAYSMITAFAFLILLFAAFAVFSYATFGKTTNSNIFNSLPNTWFANVGRATMLVVCTGAYPLMVLPMMSSLGPKFKSGEMKVVGVSTIVFTAMFAGWWVQDLGILNETNGAFCVSVFVGFAPGICGYKFLNMSKLAAILLIVVSVACTITGLIFTDNYTENLTCLWSVGTGAHGALGPFVIHE